MTRHGIRHSATDETLNPLPPAATQADLDAMNSGGVQAKDAPQSNKPEGLLHNVLAGALVGLILVLSYLLFVGT